MRPSLAHISLSALRENLLAVRRCAPAAKIAAVVKANAYGHGAEPCAVELEKSSDALAVANIEEALTLRGADIKAPILLLEGQFQASELATAAAQSFWLMVHSAEQIQQILDYSPSAALNVWLKVDTGMHRLGLSPDSVLPYYRALQECRHVNSVVVLASHFASAEAHELNTTQQQISTLNTINEQLNAPVSLANSAAILAHPDSHRDWVRPGIMLYGCSPAGPIELSSQCRLTPVMSLQSEVIAIRELTSGEGVGYRHSWKTAVPSHIATVAIGYADGYPRSAPSGTAVIVDGQAAALCGTVSMDMITVDVTGLNNIRIGSKVELWGRQLPVAEVAQRAGTLSYELLARMPSRVPRRYD